MTNQTTIKPAIGRELSAIDLADALKLPRPTDQQRAVIEAPLEPALVVAGAGSGKTETMANRVLWLLANGHVRAHEVLGLTFTRKAAGELGSRIRRRIEQLASAGLAPEFDPFEAPFAATYNSFANSIYRDHAALIGRDSDGTVLSEASAWQLARSVVLDSRIDRLAQLDKSVDQVTKAVVGLSTAIAEHQVDRAELAEFAAGFLEVERLPLDKRGAKYEDRMSRVREVASLEVLAELAGEFAAAKRKRGLLEYSDQVTFALEIANGFPQVAVELRSRYSVVLLDEYQDTSVVQTRLLAALFAGHPVMAVGDPHQSIYGWRGASAGNLEGFGAAFGAARTFSLSTSWRNGRQILAAANTLVEPLAASSAVPVEPLAPGPAATDRPVGMQFCETLVEEAAHVAEWFASKLASGRAKPSAALLLRTRKTLPYFVQAFREKGVPFHVLGVGGLLQEPEIADLVSALTVVHDPDAGSELIRLLAGSRWRIGPRDLHALKSLAAWLRDRDHAMRPLDDEVRERMRASIAPDEDGSILDALDFVSTVSEDSPLLERFSPQARERLRDAGRCLARLRARSGLDLVDFVSFVQQELLLDIEVIANESRVGGLANLDAFFDAIESYLAIADVATLGGFLSWLRETSRRDDLSPRPEEPEPGSVQVLTIHGAKGLEWDLVAVSRLVADELPAKPLEGTWGWLAFGQLPHELRGDRDELPVLDWRSAQNRKEFVSAVNEYKDATAQRYLLEERRLAYVAVTRARHELLLTGSFWGTQSVQRRPSGFLTELARAGIVPEPPAQSEHDENPLGDLLTHFEWPLDPLGSRRSRVEAAAEAVRSAAAVETGPWHDEIDLLLAERERRLGGPAPLALPARVAASRFKDFVADPGGVAGMLRRPMPERPHRATRLGTLFHSWVEQRYRIPGSLELVDSVAVESDEGEAILDESRFEQLVANFENSPWASMRPVDVEREIHFVLDGHVFVCKIDAVYERGDRFEIVDWKTGQAPANETELAERRLQLALYRLAYAKHRNIALDRIDAMFYFVADDRVVRPARLETEAELVRLWRSAVNAQ